MSRHTVPIWILAAALAAAPLTRPVAAIVPPEGGPAAPELFRHPDLSPSERSLAAQRIAEFSRRGALAELGVSATMTQVDLRTGRFLTLLPATPLLPGKGVGNTLTWQQLGVAPPTTETALKQQAWDAFRSYLERHQGALGVNPRELPEPGRVTVIADDYLIIYAPRVVAGVPVDGSYVQANIKGGNLILLGAVNWGDLREPALPEWTVEEAADVVARHTAPAQLGAPWKGSELLWVPMASGAEVSAEQIGNGLTYRLAWAVRSDLGEPGGRYQALVDAKNGDLLALEDLRQYATTRRVVGGVYPVSNDGVAPDGVEQLFWPMPFSTVTTNVGTFVTDIGGNLPLCVDGNVSTALAGPFIAINDNCGAVNLLSAGDLDFGSGPGTDCTTPGVGGPGNTHASRSAYFELNMIKAMARGQLPSNMWLQQQLPANMNIQNTCNATWNGSAVNFFRSGGGCNNTGELAGVFDHEWGHGMDNNDANPTISNPGEGIADIYASLRLDDSCIGRNFRATNCGGYGNPCTACSGVRDIDWAKHTANTPFTLAGADACGTGGPAPCGGSVHCEGQVYSQAVWDLWNRDLTGAPFNLGKDLSREIATQLTFRGASGVGAWFACNGGTGGCANPDGCGCGATSGYQQYLAADDDNGNLADGTPHMAAINAAFARHTIACAVPAVTTAGCAGAPTGTPTVNATGIDRGVQLSWTPVAGATEYRVYRTDGVFSCDFGKQLVATVSGTSFEDQGLQNGREYSYQVLPMGSPDECFGGTISACTAATPTPGANLSLIASGATLNILTGDGDEFLDNCELAEVLVPVSNIGNGVQTNVRVVSVTSPSHPGTQIATTFPHPVAASLGSCINANAEIRFAGVGLDPGETLVLEVTVTSDQLTSNRTGQVEIRALEGDFQHFAVRTFNFDTDREGWVTIEGTFNRDNAAGGGADGTPFYLESSSFLDGQCDVVRSPALRLASNSTMTAFTRHNIEVFSGGQWWDRANFGLRRVDTGVRTLVSPDGGRLYNASGIGGTCGTEGQPGYAGVADSWAQSTWSATALQSGALAGQLVQLETRYGTDPLVNDFGFRFDQVAITNVDVEVADSQSNTCGLVTSIFADGFESGDTSAWSNTVEP
jgi:hypothetical protein